MTAVEVRPADDSDVEAMAAIYVKAARAGWAHIFDEPSLKAIEPPVDRLRAELASTDSRHQLLVAERERRAIGFAVVRPSRDADADSFRVGELDQFYCDPPAWGQGVGRQLMAAAIETLRENRFTEATLWVAELNHRPRRIYEVVGWIFDGTTRDKPWRGTSVRDLRYRMTL
jgi:GNAT superfamily N-acetyltransferase